MMYFHSFNRLTEPVEPRFCVCGWIDPRQRDRSATLASAKKCPPVKENKEKPRKVSKDEKIRSLGVVDFVENRTVLVPGFFWEGTGKLL